MPFSTPLPAEVSLDADTTRGGTVSRTLLDKVQSGVGAPKDHCGMGTVMTDSPQPCFVHPFPRQRGHGVLMDTGPSCW